MQWSETSLKTSKGCQDLLLLIVTPNKRNFQLKKIDCVLSEKTGCLRQKGCTAFKIWIACDQFQFASERVVIVLEKRKFATL